MLDVEVKVSLKLYT